MSKIRRKARARLAKRGIKKWYRDLPTWAKILLFVVVIGLILWMLSSVFSGIRKLFKGIFGSLTEWFGIDKTDDQQTHEGNLDTAISNVTYNASNLSLPTEELDLITESLFAAQEGWGTRYQEMYQALLPMNRDDLRYIYKQFGSRENSDMYNETGDLFTWFVWELSDEQTWVLFYGWTSDTYNEDGSPSDLTERQQMRALWVKSGLTLTF